VSEPVAQVTVNVIVVVPPVGMLEGLGDALEVKVGAPPPEFKKLSTVTEIAGKVRRKVLPEEVVLVEAGKSAVAGWGFNTPL